MPKYLIISCLNSDIKKSISAKSISAKFIDDNDLLETYVSWMLVMQYRVTVYEWYVPEEDEEDQMPYYKLCYETFKL